MKKTVLILGAFIAISTTSLAWGGYGHQGGGCGHGFWSGMSNRWHHMTSRGHSYRQGDIEDERAYLEAREKSSEVYNKYGVKIDQKQLEVERELLEEEPNWNKISKLNEEIAILQARARTEMMKSGY